MRCRTLVGFALALVLTSLSCGPADEPRFMDPKMAVVRLERAVTGEWIRVGNAEPDRPPRFASCTATLSLSIPEVESWAARGSGPQLLIPARAAFCGNWTSVLIQDAWQNGFSGVGEDHAYADSYGCSIVWPRHPHRPRDQDEVVLLEYNLQDGVPRLRVHYQVTPVLGSLESPRESIDFVRRP